ncbi:MAG: hypothetical protein H0V12_01050 [Chloroflexi bacterium]|nr:hypothetical protein [Chloroflexota bacterium]
MQRRRLRGKRLRWPGGLARHVARRNGTLLDREQRLAGLPIEDEDGAHLGADGNGGYFPSAVPEGKEQRLRGHIVVPEVVAHHLVRPHHGAGGAA